MIKENLAKTLTVKVFKQSARCEEKRSPFETATQYLKLYRVPADLEDLL